MLFVTTCPLKEAGSHHQAHDGVSDGGYIDCEVFDDEAYHFFMGLLRRTPSALLNWGFGCRSTSSRSMVEWRLPPSVSC